MPDYIGVGPSGDEPFSVMVHFGEDDLEWNTVTREEAEDMANKIVNYLARGVNTLPGNSR